MYTFIINTSDPPILDGLCDSEDIFHAFHDPNRDQYWSSLDKRRPPSGFLVPVNFLEWVCLQVGLEMEEIEMTELTRKIDAKLWALGYHADERSEIIEHIEIYDTAENCPVFHGEDHRGLIEGLLPDAWADFEACWGIRE